MPKFRIKAIIIFLLIPVAASAGGGWAPVKVKSLEIEGRTKYVLVVSPEKIDNGVPYLDGCPKFTVHGDYNWRFTISTHEYPNRKGHIEAIKKLKNALESGASVNLGWMGEGYEYIDPKDKCTVRSRGLAIHEGHKGDKGIVSFFKTV